MSQMAEVHVARQPIFDAKLNVIAYELLFRGNFINAFDGSNGDQATRSVIANSFLTIGIETLTHGEKAFINFTSNSLLHDIPLLLPRDMVVVEVLEDVVPTPAIINACRRLKQAGYLIALDDFAFSPCYMPLVELADIIKVDFLATPPAERQQLIRCLAGQQVKFLAEKVETQADFHSGLEMGYSYFQGYFFSKPSIISAKSLPGHTTSCLQLLRELNRPEVKYEAIEDIIKRDVAMSYKLLRFVNSAYFGFKSKIKSLRQALTLLGQKELQKWVALISLQEAGVNKPTELILESLIRARFAEQLALKRMQKQQAANSFLMGMFSYIDVLLDRPMADILNEVALDEEVKAALLEKNRNFLSLLYQLILTYEKGQWNESSCYAAELNLDESVVLKAYQESVAWAQGLLTST